MRKSHEGSAPQSLRGFVCLFVCLIVLGLLDVLFERANLNLRSEI